MDESAPEPSAHLLTIEQLAARAHVSTQTIRRWTRSGKIRFCQPSGKGGAIRYPPDALDDLAEKRFDEPKPPSAPKSTRRTSGPRPRWTKGPRA